MNIKLTLRNCKRCSYNQLGFKLTFAPQAKRIRNTKQVLNNSGCACVCVLGHTICFCSIIVCFFLWYERYYITKPLYIVAFAWMYHFYVPFVFLRNNGYILSIPKLLGGQGSYPFWSSGVVPIFFFFSWNILCLWKCIHLWNRIIKWIIIMSQYLFYKRSLYLLVMKP